MAQWDLVAEAVSCISEGETSTSFSSEGASGATSRNPEKPSVFREMYQAVCQAIVNLLEEGSGLLQGPLLGQGYDASQRLHWMG